MREHLAAFFDRLFPPPPSYSDRLYDALNKGVAAASRAGHEASRFGSASLQAAPTLAADALQRGASAASRLGRDASRLGAASLDSLDEAQARLARYGLTPEMIAGLAAPQLRRLQRQAVKAAARNPGTLAGSLVMIGALGLIAYAISRESQQLAAPNVVRQRH